MLLKSFKDARFPNTYKAVPYGAKPKAADSPYYLKSIIDFIKYLVTEIETDQPITGRAISIECLYTSIESTNWLLIRGIATVGTFQKGRNKITSDLFDTQNRFFVQLFIFKRRRNKFASHLISSKQSQKERKVLLWHRPPDHCMAKQLMTIKRSPNNQILRLHKKCNGYSRPAE